MKVEELTNKKKIHKGCRTRYPQIKSVINLNSKK